MADRARRHSRVVVRGLVRRATPQLDAALADPVNALERDHDPDGKWRRHANAMLAGPHRALFGRIDLLVLLAAPDRDVVYGWRLE